RPNTGASGGRRNPMRFQPSTSNAVRRSITALAATALVFAMLGGTALAAPVVRDHIASSGVGATSTVCVGTVCTATSVFVVVDNSGGASQACLDISRYDSVAFLLLGYENGCAPVAESGFSMDTKGLASAALSPIDITLQAFTCDSNGCLPTGAPRVAHLGPTYTGGADTTPRRSSTKQRKFQLYETDLPTNWYNVQADVPSPPPPPLHPGTGQPLGPADLAPLFPMELIKQEVSRERWIEIPEPVRDAYKVWRPTPLIRALGLEKVLGTPAHIYYTWEGTS